jgi:hypothetical protein
MRTAYFWDIKKRGMVVFTDVSAQPIGTIFKGQAVKENCMTLKDETDVVSRNVGKKPQFYAA